MNQKNMGALGALLLLFMGIFLIIRPGTALRTVVIFLSVILLINGVIMGLAYFNERESRLSMNLAGACVAILFGVVGLLRPNTIVSIFPIICGVGFVLGGLGGLAGAYQERQKDAGTGLLRVLVAALLIVIGVVMFINPFSSALTMTRVTGWFLAISGGFGVLLAMTKSW